MDLFYRLIEKKWVILAAGLIPGLLLGLFYAWVIDPVKWEDGTPAHMRDDLRQDYLRMAIDSYSVNTDENLAMTRYGNLGKFAEDTLAKVGANPGTVSPNALQNFSSVAANFALDEPQKPSNGGATPPPQGGGVIAALLGILPYFCGGVILIAIAVVGLIFVRRRMQTGEEYSAPAYEEYEEEEAYYQEPEMDMRFMDAVGSGSKDPLATFRTIYSLGDDLYDDSFSIEGPTGDFLGECGVGIGEIIGVGDPKKVSAFEVWLFDKNDIQTETKVLLSTYAYNDMETRNRLAAKGDPILAQNGGIIELETESLKVEARIVDMTYGEGALPSESFFERIAIELRAYYVG